MTDGSAIPRRLNIGSGRMWDEASVNIDIRAAAGPDIVADVSDPHLVGRTYATERFGAVELKAGGFSHITASHVLEHVPDLVGFMTNCLELLEEGGVMAIRVPYDLSFGAWQDPTHLRGFNERSWLYYTSWHWHIGWDRARFEIVAERLVLSPLGIRLRKEGMSDEELTTRPRAIDEAAVELRKRTLTAEEREAGRAQAAGHLKARPELARTRPAPAVDEAVLQGLYLDLLVAWAGEDGNAAMLDAVRRAAETVLAAGIEGDLLAAGADAADRGAVMAAALRSRGKARPLWIAVDGDGGQAKARLARFGLGGEPAEILSACDRDGLVHMPADRLAMVTIGGPPALVGTALPAVFDRLVPGGWIVIDPAGRPALEAFLARRRIVAPAPAESPGAVSWQRPRTA